VSSSSASLVRIATRESPLALWQAHYVAGEIRRTSPDVTVELVPLSTSGDRDRISTLSSMGGQGVFTREIQRAVLTEIADLAVHSLKDLPTEPTAGLLLAGVPKRASRFDALVLPAGTTGTLEQLKQAARVGTSSPRRQAQLLRFRPDLQLLEVRGNVDTRLAKLDQGDYDAIILAAAGLERLGLGSRASQMLMPPVMFPAVGQAALGIECRSSDIRCQELLKRFSDPGTGAEVLAERSCLATLRAGCHAPVGVLTRQAGSLLHLEAVVLSLDGRQFWKAEVSGSSEHSAAVGAQAAQQLLDQGATVGG